jgi:5-formyltetrahydrofolate cyclo-ligase
VTARAEPGPGPSDGTGRAAAGGPAKDELRRRLLAARRALPPAVRAERARALTREAVRLAARTGGPVCAYLPVGGEPGSIELVDALVAAGHEVLLPVVPARPGPLDWARYRGPADLALGPLGLREPTGPRLGPGALAAARLVLLPGLAADPAGRRLGRGGGYYDRTLDRAAPGTPLVIVLHDEELLDAVPAEPHDRLVTGALLPGGFRKLGNNG